MAVTGTETVRDIITDALLSIGAATLGQAVAAEEMAVGIRHLERLMKKWQGQSYLRGLVASQSVTLVADQANYTLNPIRPARILNCRYMANSIELPMIELSRQEYDELPQKASQGVPTQFYYDKQNEAAVYYIWPLMASVTTETIEITYEREFEDIASANDTIDIAAEWYDAVVLNLGASLLNVFPSPTRTEKVMFDAKEAFDSAVGNDAEDSTYFRGEDY